MLKFINKKTTQMAAAVYVGVTLGASDAMAAGGGQTFSTLSNNMLASVTDIPALLSGLSYLLGILFGVLGVLKIKDHVENPGNAPLKDGAMRLGAGGALLTLPFIYDIIATSVDAGTAGTVTQQAIPQVQVG